MVFVSICSVNEGEPTVLSVIEGQAEAESLSLFSDNLGDFYCDATLPVEEKDKLVLLTKFASYKQGLVKTFCLDRGQHIVSSRLMYFYDCSNLSKTFPRY
jgi:hypothetical protein